MLSYAGLNTSHGALHAPDDSNTIKEQTIHSLREMLEQTQSRFTEQTYKNNIHFQGFEPQFPEGLPRGTMVDLAGPISCGKTSFALSLLASVTRSGKHAALIDGTGHIFPPSLQNFQAKTTHLLLVRASEQNNIARPDSKRLLWATNQVLRSGLFELVVLLGLKRYALTALRQLQRSSEQSQSILLLVHANEQNIPGGLFHTRMELCSAPPTLTFDPASPQLIAPPQSYTLSATQRGRKSLKTALQIL